MAEDSSGSPRTPALARLSGLFHLVQPLLGVCDPPQLVGKREALVVPVVRFIPRLCAALILAPQLGVFPALHLRTCPSVRFFLRAAGRFFLTISGSVAYSNRRRGFPLLSAGFGNGIGRAILYGGGASSLHFPHVIYDHSAVSVSGGNCHPVSLSIKVSKLRFSVNPSVPRKLSVNWLTVSCGFIFSRFLFILSEICASSSI